MATPPVKSEQMQFDVWVCLSVYALILFPSLLRNVCGGSNKGQNKKQ